MKTNLRGLLAAGTILCAIPIGGPAFADNYTAKDGNGSFITFAAKLVGGILHPFHIGEGLNSSTGNPQAQTIDNASGGVNVNVVGGSLSASFTGFTPTAGAVANLSVSTSSSDVALPAGASIIVTNPGSQAAYIRMQTGAGTAVTTDMVIGANVTCGFTVGSATHLSAITASSSTTLNIQGGSGSATGCSGAGGSSGGGGAITAASGALAAGSIVDIGTGSSPGSNTLNGRLSSIATNQSNTTGPVAPGTAPSSAVVGGCVYNSTLPSPSNSQVLAEQCDAKGNRRGVIMDGAGNARSANVTAGNALQVDGSAVTQPVSASALPLPAGASTSANQATTNSILGSGNDTTCPSSSKTLDGCAYALLQAAGQGVGNTAASAPTQAIQMGFQDGSGNLQAPSPTNNLPVYDAALVAPDYRPSTVNITAQDTGSTSSTGQDGVTIYAGTPTTNSSAAWTVNGAASADFQLSGTWTGTAQFERSVDSGTTWEATTCHVMGSSFFRSAVTGNGIYECETAGATNLRIRSTASMTGTIVARLSATPNGAITKAVAPGRLVDNGGDPAAFYSSGGAINISTATTSQLIAAVTGQKIYAEVNWEAQGTTTVSFVYGTGTNCGSGTTTIAGPYAEIAQTGQTMVHLIVPAGNALCIANSAAVQVGGGYVDAQF